MVVRESQLIHNGIQEALSGAVVQLVDNLLESVSVLHASFILACLLSNVQNYRANDVLVDVSFTINDDFTLFHLKTDFRNILQVPGSLKVVKIVF